MDNNNNLQKHYGVDNSTDSVIEEVELGKSANDTITIDDVDDSDSENSDVEENSIYFDAECLKEIKAIDEKYNECIALKQSGNMNNLYEAYCELKQLTKDFYEYGTFENERIAILVLKVKSDLAIMRSRLAETNLKNNNYSAESNESDTDSVKIYMSSDVITDYIIDKDEDGYKLENERVKARSFAFDTDERFKDLQKCFRELKICVGENRNLYASQKLNVKITKLNAAMKVFACQKSFTDFHSKQLRGEMKNHTSSVYTYLDVGGSMDVNHSLASVSNNRTINESMECVDSTLQQENPLLEFDFERVENFPVSQG